MEEAFIASNITGWNGTVSLVDGRRVEGSHGCAVGCFCNRASLTVHEPFGVSITSSRPVSYTHL
ncbi:MAG: hypothetical protein MPK62_11595, partial [Alphaproteobacteria bacterium]|nr:hypothetical protein [Alphaproteobacteria bacterium]